MRYFSPTNIYRILKEHGFFPLWLYNSISFLLEEKCLLSLSENTAHFKEKELQPGEHFIFRTPVCPPSPSDILKWAFSLCKGSLSSRSQGSLLPSAFPGDPQAVPYSTTALSLSVASPYGCDCLGTTPAHLSHCSLCPCGGPLSPHASSFSDAVGPHFTPVKLLCDMALGKDVIYLSIPSLWVILLCLPPTWHACFVNFLSIVFSLTPNTLLPFQLTGCSFLDSAFSSILD